MRVLEHNHPMAPWLDALLNAWPLCIHRESVRTLFALASDALGTYRPGDESLFYNGVAMIRLTLPAGLWLHLKPTIDRRLQVGVGWKLNGRFGLVLRWQSDASAAAGVHGPNLGQATGWERGAA